MNKIGLALKELYRAEEELADEYVKVGERLAAEHDVWYDCRRFAEQSHAHADAIRPFAARHEQDLGPPDGDTVGETTTAALRHKLSEVLGRRPESGLLLLRSLRQLYLQAHEVSFDWIIAGQLAQATRDQTLLSLADSCGAEAERQVSWAETKLKESVVQAMATP